ncbi:MAG TPA: hypothetical protein VE570_10355 [Thermoleophilaceae bacterium]|nr:hypothetical protein [Thermoleophilaceae bacterium]
MAHSARHIAIAPASGGEHPSCESCGAPLDSLQRYCVGCGARRRDAGEPALEWMAGRRPARQPARAASPRPPRNPLLAPALFLVLLPAAVAGGVALANHRASDDQKLIDALRAQRPPVVTVAGGSAATSSTASPAARHHAGSARKSSSGKVLTHSKVGTAHAVSGFKPSASKVASDRVAVQKVTKEVGKNYLQSQKNLPDTIVVTGSPGSGSGPAPQGRGD